MKTGTNFLSHNFDKPNIDTRLQEDVEKYFLRLPTGMQKVMQYIWKNYNRPIYASTLSLQAGIKNETYFGKVFKKKMGCSYTYFINGIRIKVAREKLDNTNLSISEISKYVGFNDIASFHRVFKHFENTSPSAYRKKLTSKYIIEKIPVIKKIDLLSNVSAISSID